MGPSFVASVPNSARALLVDWANQQDGWVRLLISEVLSSATSVAEGFLDDVYRTFAIEKGLMDGERVEVSALSDSGATKDEIESLALTQLSELQNVNALATGQGIDFNPKLTILFGQNASGKTGYVRVLKMAAAVRTAEKIIPNVADASKPSGTPSALIRYRLGDKDNKVVWKNESGLPPFTRIDVFDSTATNLHVDGDLNYVYTPAELARFPRAQKGIESIKARLESDIAAATKSTNTFTMLFARGTRAYTLVEALGASTDLAGLRSLATVTEAEKGEIEPLRNEIDALKSASQELQIKATTELKQKVEALGKAFVTLDGIDLKAYSDGLERVKAAGDQYEEVTQRSFAGLSIPGLLKDPWREFIQAGEQYLASINAAQYPSEDANCSYCQQPLGGPAVELLKKYRDFCNNNFRAELTNAQKAVDGVASPLRTALNFPDLQRQLSEMLSVVPQLVAADRDVLQAVISVGQDTVAAMTERRPVTWPDKDEAIPRGREVLKGLWEQSNKVLKELTAKKDEREKILRQKEARIADLESRLKLAQAIPAIEEFVGNAKWTDKARIHQKKFATLQRSLTEASKTASQKLLNQDFEKLFLNECRLLRAPAVTLQFPGKEGQVVRKKTSSGYQPSDILSEGEQKVTALADFLAEASLRPPAPVIFDDPINSLDYVRMGEVVKRMVGLTEHRQVIVFTHNIWFATKLLSEFEKRKSDCSYYDVSREGERIGVVSKGTHPRSDSVKNLRARIHTVVQTAEKQAGEVRQALVENAYGILRSLCEVVVESELLAGVTTRYEPNVKMTVLGQIKGEALRAATEAICPVFDDCCRYMESHSQPLETLNVRPTLDTFKADLKKVLEARDAYLQA